MTTGTRQTLHRARTATIAILLLFFLAVAAHSQQPPAQPANAELSKDLSPVDVYRAYLNAVKANDLEAAKACWWLPGDDKSALDVVAGFWVASHRFNTAIAKAGIETREIVPSLLRNDCTDTAINRTLARLKGSKVTLSGDSAKLIVEWEKNDGYPNAVFWFADDPIHFRKTKDGWRIDAVALCGGGKPEDWFTSGLGAAMFRHTKMINEIASGLESRKLRSAKDVLRVLKKHIGSIEGRVPGQRTVIYEEDSPERYLRITKGNPRIHSCGGTTIPHRKEIEFPRRSEGDVPTVFQDICGWENPRIVVETSNKKGYEVVFDPEDEKAMEIVAEQLGMTLGEEEREILAFQIAVTEGGHKMKQVEKPDKPQWHACVRRNGIWPLQGVTMEELGLFLESQCYSPVVNKTGLEGYFWVDIPDKSIRALPNKPGKVRLLGQTGLQLTWKRTKAKVLVVKDKPKPESESSVKTGPTATPHGETP